MSIPLILGLSYAVLAALLLALNLHTPHRREIKLATIALVSLFYYAAYHGAQDLRGWAIADTPPNPFKLHWAVVEEPDKSSSTKGAIYILAQPVSQNGVLLSRPRLYVVPFSAELAEQIDAALKQAENGKRLEATLSYKAKRPDPDEVAQTKKRDGEKSHPDSVGDEDRLKLDFRELPVADLPPKSTN